MNKLALTLGSAAAIKINDFNLEGENSHVYHFVHDEMGALEQPRSEYPPEYNGTRKGPQPEIVVPAPAPPSPAEIKAPSAAPGDAKAQGLPSELMGTGAGAAQLVQLPDEVFHWNKSELVTHNVNPWVAGFLAPHDEDNWSRSENPPVHQDQIHAAEEVRRFATQQTKSEEAQDAATAEGEAPGKQALVRLADDSWHPERLATHNVSPFVGGYMGNHDTDRLSRSEEAPIHPDQIAALKAAEQAATQPTQSEEA